MKSPLLTQGIHTLRTTLDVLLDQSTGLPRSRAGVESPFAHVGKGIACVYLPLQDVGVMFLSRMSENRRRKSSKK